MVSIERFDDDIVINPEESVTAFAFDINQSVELEDILSNFESKEIENEDAFSILRKVEDNDVGCFECGSQEDIFVLRNEKKGDLFLVCDECQEEVFGCVLEYIEDSLSEVVSRNI